MNGIELTNGKAATSDIVNRLFQVFGNTARFQSVNTSTVVVKLSSGEFEIRQYKLGVFELSDTHWIGITEKARWLRRVLRGESLDC